MTGTRRAEWLILPTVWGFQGCEGPGLESSPAHQPVLIFTRDPYLNARASTTPTIANSVIKGVLTALYDQNFHMPA